MAVNYFDTATSILAFHSCRQVTLSDDEVKTFASKVYSNIQHLQAIIVLPRAMINLAHIEPIITQEKAEEALLQFTNRTDFKILGENFDPFIELINKRTGRATESKIIRMPPGAN